MTKTGKAKSAHTDTMNSTIGTSAQAKATGVGIVSFVKRHPVLTVAGAIAVGAAVSALVPRRTGRRLMGKALALAETAGVSGALASLGTGEKVGVIRHVTATLSDRTEEAGQAAARHLEKFGLAALAAAAGLGKATSDRAGKMGDAVQEGSHKVWTIANDMTTRLRR